MESDKGIKILVVDDNPAGRYSTSRILQSAGFVVLEAETGSEGLDKAPLVEAVVLDVNLPDISGFDVCRKIRADARTARLPVIHLSATFVKDVDKVQGLEAGADGYLTHPVEPPVLVATINAFLRARRAEEEMRRSEAKFRAIFDQAESGILLLSRELILLEANPAMGRMLGRGREAIVGQSLWTFKASVGKIDRGEIEAELEARGAWRGTFALSRADGTQLELEWNISRHSVSGVYLALVSDITERLAHEAERERLLAGERAARAEAELANRLKDEFLAMLSHELRTPLNAIVGWSQILLGSRPSDADLAEGLEAIERNTRAQAQLISDLLDVSRITSGKLRLDLRPTDLAATVHESLETLAHAVQGKRLELTSELDRTLGVIAADAQRIQQVVWNLVNNAVKFTPEGGRIRVTLEADDGFARLTVEDSGRGFKRDFLPHIFEQFRQEDASSKRNQGGLGLGLAIVKRLVELHGGTVEAQSEGEGRGARFIVRLPRVAATTEVSPASVRTVEAGGNGSEGERLHGIRVLVVEDDDDARNLLKRALKRAGAEVQEAESVKSAMERITSFKPNVLVSDVGMPHEDGYDLIRQTRAMGLSAEKLPAIALTAFARGEDEERSLAAGFQLHLSKPVHQGQLVAAVASVAKPNRK
jgi:PAS domain S-box-containing protein